jgi:hypothetical protein
MQPTTQGEFFCALQDREFNFEKILLKLVKYKLMDLLNEDSRNTQNTESYYVDSSHSTGTQGEILPE